MQVQNKKEVFTMSLVLTIPRRRDYQVVPWSDLKKSEPDLQWGNIEKFLLPVGIGLSLTLMQPHMALALGTKGLMIKAFSPIVDLVQGASYPLALISISAGMLLITMGNRHKGMEFIKWGALGFIGMQFIPGIMEILMQAGAAVSGG
jgi:hypothetical protein